MTSGSSSGSPWLRMGVDENADGWGRGAIVGVLAPNVGGCCTGGEACSAMNNFAHLAYAYTHLRDLDVRELAGELLDLVVTGDLHLPRGSGARSVEGIEGE